MDGSARAAQLAEEAQSVLARIDADAEQYLILRLAHAVLQEGLERYRKKNEAGVLGRASDLFRALTRGSFSRLEIEANEKGEQVVVGIRAGTETPVAVEHLSDGTRDQLYLALRLASLEVYLAAHEPMPFIVDDLLLNFDDERAAATFAVLAELSRKTQVLFFTHHRHLVEQARKTPAEGVFYHALTQPAS
jgi:uncharacterized protein YhaN